MSVKKASDGVKGIHGYDVETQDGSIEIVKRKVTINQDGTITYGSKDGIKYGTPTSAESTDIKGLTNGDTIGSITMKTSEEYQKNKGTRNTGDAGIYDLTTDGTQTTILNNGKNVSINYDIDGGGKLIVDKATLHIKTDSNTRSYGDHEGVTSDLNTATHFTDAANEVVNGDDPDAIFSSIGAKNTSDALLDATHTNSVKKNTDGGYDSYAIDTKYNKDLDNYTVELIPGTETLVPKDIYVRVDGNGHTTQNITYVDPDIDSKLSYGDHATWTPNLGGQTGEFTYDVITDINGHPFKPGESEVIGNYRFHYDGVAVVSPSKPDIDPPVVPPVVPGNGGYTLPTNPQTPSEKESGTVEKDWGTRDEGPGVDRERHIIKVQLPFFKIDDGKMTNYGTYDVKSQAAKVDISPTGKRLPEPNQPKTQYREYTKDITTSDGTGEFRLIYNGSTFHVMPLDAAARTMMQTGDEKHNVDLFAQALHIGFSEMGIIPADLDGVYANFQDIAADAQNNSK